MYVLLRAATFVCLVKWSLGCCCMPPLGLKRQLDKLMNLQHPGHIVENLKKFKVKPNCPMEKFAAIPAGSGLNDVGECCRAAQVPEMCLFMCGGTCPGLDSQKSRSPGFLLTLCSPYIVHLASCFLKNREPAIFANRTTSESERPTEPESDLLNVIRDIRRFLGKEFITPNGDLKVGHDIAEWDEAPSPSEVKEKIDGKSYEERSGTLLTGDLQVARYVPNPVETMIEQTELHGKNWLEGLFETLAKGKIVAGDPAELNVLNLPFAKGGRRPKGRFFK